MAFFGSPYPRERGARKDALEAAWEASGNDDYDPFNGLDESFFELPDTENSGFEAAADEYAAANG